MQIVGSGNAKELFYTDSRVKQAYKNYVYMLLTRTNTYTGIQYKNDPTIFSFELMVSNAPLELHRSLQSPCQDCLMWCLHRLALHACIGSHYMTGAAALLSREALQLETHGRLLAAW